MQVVIDSLKGDRLDMKKRVLHFLISFVLVFAFLFGGLNFSIQADASSGKVKLSAKKLYMLTTHLTTMIRDMMMILNKLGNMLTGLKNTK